MNEDFPSLENRDHPKKSRFSIAAKLTVVLVVTTLLSALVVAIWGVRVYLPQKELEALERSTVLMRAAALAGRGQPQASGGVGLASSLQFSIIAGMAFENPAVDYFALHRNNGELIRASTRNSTLDVPPLILKHLPRAEGRVRFIPLKDEGVAGSGVYMSEGGLLEGNPFRGLVSDTVGRDNINLEGVRPVSELSTRGQNYVSMVMRWNNDDRYGEVYLRQVLNLDHVRWQLWEELKVMVLLAVIAVVVAIIAVGVYARRALAPLTLLEMATAKVTEGETVGQIPVQRKDEIGDLTAYFNVMNTALGSYRREVLAQKRDLEDKVMERTKELSESNRKAKNVMRQAVEAKLSAEEASRAKSEFLATMSHEIRTPLNGVLGMAEIMEHTALDAAQREYLQIISQSGRTLLELINDILDFSKIEAGTLDFNFSDFDLRELIEEIGAAFADPAQKKNIEMVCSVPPDMNLIVNSDITRIRQVLSNLVGNAVKFTEHGMVKLSVEVLEQLDDKVQLRFEVRDTGIGISENMLEQIFQSFSQADGSTTRRYGGTGLGLAIVKQVVELAGGKVAVDSKPGLGTLFTVDLWVGAREFESGEFQNTINDMPNLKVLVVDDLSVNREIVVNQLRIWGVDCHEAASGAEAIRLLRIATESDRRYDIILLDYHMPEMDGLQLATLVSQDDSLAGIPMIMLSSVHNLGSRESLQKVGIQSYLTKPVRQTDLFNALVNLASGLAKSDVVEKTSGNQPQTAIEAKILVVEDNIVNQKVARAVFDWLGVDLTVANNGGEAFKLRKQFAYDMIFMDCQMPVMDGYQATQAIRQWEQENSSAGHMPIIALTANAIEGDREKCLTAGMDDYLSKPFNSEQIRKKIERWNVKPESSTHSTSAIEESATVSLAAARKPVDIEVAGSRVVDIKTVAGSKSARETGNPARTTVEKLAGGRVAFKEEAGAAPLVVRVGAPNGNIGASTDSVESMEQAGEADGRVGDGGESSTAPSSAAQDRGAGNSASADFVDALVDFALLDSYKELQAPGEPDLRVMLVETFLEEAPTIIKRKMEAIDAGDAAGIADAAHALKSSSANVGAVVMSRLSKEIEADARSGMLDDIAGLAARLERTFKQTESQYRERFGLS